MAAGDTTVERHAISTSGITSAINALRVTANDKWFFVPVANGQEIILIHIEEA